MFAEELLALAMAETEEDDVDLVERHLGSESQVGIADESFVNVADQIARIALGIGKDNLSRGVVQQQADQLAAGVAGSA